MKGPEIFALVRAKTQQLKESFDPTTFVLNKEAEKLQAEIEELQQICPHRYTKEHVCKYCGKEEQQ